MKSVCSPGFNCHGCPWATSACPVGVITYGSAMRTLPALAASTVLAVGAVAGRLVCSFVCPFGLFQDLMYRIPTPKIRLPKLTRYGKYAALALLVVIFPFLLGFEPSGYLGVEKPEVSLNPRGEIDVAVTVRNLGTEPVTGPVLTVLYRDAESDEEVWRATKTFPDVTVPPAEAVTLPTFQVPNKLISAGIFVESPQSTVSLNPRYKLYYCKLCPKGTLTAALPAAVTGATTGMYGVESFLLVRYGILAFFLILMVLSSRPFCRTFCPLGAIYGMISYLSLARIVVDKTACTECRRCDKVCPVDLDVMNEAGDPECIACGECVSACPSGAIERRFGF